MKTAIVFIGIQASGKSTFYRRYFRDYVHINLDTLHTRNKENLLLQKCFDEGSSFAIDNTNPTPEERARYIAPAKENGYKVIGYYFQSSVSESIKRNDSREGKEKIPTAAIAATHKKLVLPCYAEGFDELYYVKTADGDFSIEEWKED